MAARVGEGQVGAGLLLVKSHQNGRPWSVVESFMNSFSLSVLRLVTQRLLSICCTCQADSDVPLVIIKCGVLQKGS